MNTVQTTTYEYDATGQIIQQTVTREEQPSGQFLRIDGLTEEQIAHLVAIRDAFQERGASDE